MRLEPIQNLEEEGKAQVFTETKILENRDKIIPKEKADEPRFHAHLVPDQSKQTYLEKFAPVLSQKIPEQKRALIENKSVDFLIGKFEPGKFNQTYVSTVRDLTKHGINAKKISDLIEQTYGNLPSTLTDKVGSQSVQPKEGVATADPQSSVPEPAKNQEEATDSQTTNQWLRVEEGNPPAPAETITREPDIGGEMTIRETADLKNGPAIDISQIRDTGKELHQLRNQMVIEQAREIASHRHQTTLAEVRELSDELARIRRELILQRVDEVKDQMIGVLKDAANGAKNFSVAMASWIKEVAGHIGQLTREAIEKFKNNSSIAEYATLFKAAVEEPEKYMKGKELYDRDYDSVEKKLQESSGTTEKPPKLLVRLYANSLAYEA